ncbi:MAG: thymidine phosphorylase [Pseudomonadota bacterium]
MDARRILIKLRDGAAPSAAELAWFAEGLASGAVTDAQAGAFAMAVCGHGLGDRGRVALTQAMRASGSVLDWDLPGPIVDKHSTGGLGDCVSLLLAPILAETGAFVPMISGRALGHTGGTLDKLEAIPGFRVDQDERSFRRIVREVGAAIVAATRDLAPADRRLYAVRDVTGTVESVDLITASILSKKLAAGLEALVLDVKCGSGAFMEREEDARSLAEALVATANGAGCKTSALLTDMDQPLARSAGNAVEVAEVMATLSDPKPSRLVEVTLALAGEVLALSGAAGTAAEGAETARDALVSLRALERFGRLVAAQGGPSDFADAWRYHLPEAPVIEEVAPNVAGHVAAIDGRALGQIVIELGGGRLTGHEKIDVRVGVSGLPAIGEPVDPGTPLARIHAADEASAARAASELVRAIRIKPEPRTPPDLIRARIAV